MLNVSYTYVACCCARPNARYYPKGVELEDSGSLSASSDKWFFLKLLQVSDDPDGQAERISELYLDYTACYAQQVYVEVMREGESVLHEPVYLNDFFESKVTQHASEK